MATYFALEISLSAHETHFVIPEIQFRFHLFSSFPLYQSIKALEQLYLQGFFFLNLFSPFILLYHNHTILK